VVLSFFLLTFLLRNFTTWGVNDDFVIEQIINSQEHPYFNSIVSFMSLPLGFLLAATYKIFGDYSWYGILITLSNLVFLIATIYILNSYNNKIIRNISIFVLALVFPFLVINPTYTVTSILLSFSGLFLFLNNVKLKNNKKAIFFASGFVLALGIAIRIDSLVGLLVFFGPFAIVYIFQNRIHKIKLGNLILFVLPTLTLFILQYAINFMVQTNNDENTEYLKWQENRHELFYTPAILKLHQNVAAGNVLKDTWGDVEFTLLRNWAYGDQSVYSSKNLETGRNYVDSYIGIRGLNNADPLKVLETLFSYLNDVKLFIFISVGLIFVGLALSRDKFLFSKLITPLVGSFIISFYYGAAVLRLPIRVTVPYLITFMLVVLFCAEISGQKYANSRSFQPL
jgi:4-amino-4-deoxy-L-arabinose transferase-like glycosyltransferase